MSIIDNPKTYYRDEYLVEEDKLGSSGMQSKEIINLRLTLQHQSAASPQPYYVSSELNFYHDVVDNSEKLIVPDIAVFKGIALTPQEGDALKSWNMRQGKKPCPPLVIEVSSEATYLGDIASDRKPRLYGLMGVKEYYSYDPHTPPVYPRRIKSRLLGWRYDTMDKAIPIEPDAMGRIWSEVLESWLVPDEGYLRLYDREGNRRLTGEEAAQQQAQIAHQREEAAQQQAQAAQQREQAAQQQAEVKDLEVAESKRLAALEVTARQLAEAQAKAAQQRAEAKDLEAAENKRQAEAKDQQIADLLKQIEDLRRKPGS